MNLADTLIQHLNKDGQLILNTEISVMLIKWIANAERSMAMHEETVKELQMLLIMAGSGEAEKQKPGSL